jgi:hypothetical protein
LPNRVVKVTVSEEVFQELRQRAFRAELPVAAYVRKLVDRHVLGAPVSPVEGEGEQTGISRPHAGESRPAVRAAPSPPEPVDKVVDLMGKRASVAAAKEARVRHKAGPTPCAGAKWEDHPTFGKRCPDCGAPKDRHE